MGGTDTSTEVASAVPGANGDMDDFAAALLPSRLAAEPAPVAEPKRAAWEYRTELIQHGFIGWRSEQVDLRKLQARLDELGEDGWELVHVSWNHRVRRTHGGHLLLFKRPRP